MAAKMATGVWRQRASRLVQRGGERLRRLFRRRRNRVLAGLGLVLTLVYAFCLPEPLFEDPYSTVLLDREGRLLGARIAPDGQWRFPAPDTVPAKFRTALLAFEDKRFPYHPGVDPLAVGRALWLNLSRGEVVSGGSTISMQVIRLARKGQSRTVGEKLLEMVLATRLEWRYAKADILALYAGHAPFGGNVVGLETAAWKYYGREAGSLSWAEAATLAVLPNAPALIHPGRNREALRLKRNRLLDKLLEMGEMDSTAHYLACLEPLPERPLPLPMLAPHLLERTHQERLAAGAGGKARIRTTLDHDRQVRANALVARHYAELSENGIHNAGALIVEVATGDVVAYVGNTPCDEPGQGCAVDVIPARRSTGSILKPLLYAAMLQDGELLPRMLVPDVPAYFGSYHPDNYDRSYQGAVPAAQALARSLNVPSVHLLQRYGVARFQRVLQQVGLTTVDRPADDYGLTLILGGAEASLWDLAGVYASMARTLRYFGEYDGRYDPAAFRPPNLYLERRKLPLGPEKRAQLVRSSPLEAGPIWHTLEAMVAVSRPEADRFWELFASSDRIAWKTGTSYGYRDAWAIGLTPRYVVAVWVGNADGEGRPGLIGLEAAAPLMFDLFDALAPGRDWFAQPYDDLAEITVCRESGHRAGAHCPVVDSVWVPQRGLHTPPCPYHQVVFLDASGTYRVHGDCESPQAMRREVFLVLPPAQAAYYRRRHPDYRALPPFRDDCRAGAASEGGAMDLVYPKARARIYVPVDLDGRRSQVVFEALHRDPAAVIYWHLDEVYLGQTKGIHDLAVDPAPGPHVLTLVDGQGARLERSFEVLHEEEETGGSP